MTDMYSDPAKFDLEILGEIDWSSGCYEFALTVIWRRISDGYLVYADDAGCSCPSPFEDKGIEDLTVLPKRGTLAALKAHLDARNAGSHYGRRDDEIVRLIERLHAAGVR